MREESYNYLYRLYEGYRNSLEARKKLRSKSALLSSLTVKNNERFRAMSDASKSFSCIPAEVLMDLKREWIYQKYRRCFILYNISKGHMGY